VSFGFRSDVRPTPVQRNGNAEAMRAVPQFEPRTVVANVVSPWERIATDIGGNVYASACAAPGDPLFYQPQAIAIFGGDYGELGPQGAFDGAATSDTHYRMVKTRGVPNLVKGTMQGFLGALGDDSDGLPDDFFAGLSESPSVPTDSSGLPAGFFSGASASPLPPSGSVFYTDPAAPNFANDLTFAPPTVTVPVLSATTATANTSAVQQAQAQAITASAAAANTALRTATGTTALSVAQQQALLAAQNPLAQVVPGLNMTVGNLLLMGGVLIGGAVLISKLK
jgi:hypothetical protein